MKTILVLCLTLSCSFAYADCASKLANFALGIKFKGVLTDKLFGESSAHRGKKPDADVICKEAMEYMAEEIASKNKVLKMIRKELQEKKKVTSVFLGSLTDEEPQAYTTEPELCSLAEKNIMKYTANEDVPENTLRQYSNQDFLQNPEENCKKLVAQIYKEKAQKYAEAIGPKREPPGEEIAPADEPQKTRSLFSTKGVQQPTESTERAKVRSSVRSGSGASSQ
jgi:hypothetical protein